MDEVANIYTLKNWENGADGPNCLSNLNFYADDNTICKSEPENGLSFFRVDLGKSRPVASVHISNSVDRAYKLNNFNGELRVGHTD